MDADTVLWYVRSRKSTNDFARNRRQQEILLALFQKLLTLDAIRRAPEFYNIFKESVTTDIGLLEILSWLPLVARVAETGEIKNYYVGPGQVYDWITPDGAMVLVPNQGLVMHFRKSQICAEEFELTHIRVFWPAFTIGAGFIIVSCVRLSVFQEQNWTGGRDKMVFFNLFQVSAAGFFLPEAADFTSLACGAAVDFLAFVAGFRDGAGLDLRVGLDSTACLDLRAESDFLFAWPGAN
jgi:hypothetical protein